MGVYDGGGRGGVVRGGKGIRMVGRERVVGVDRSMVGGGGGWGMGG